MSATSLTPRPTGINVRSLVLKAIHIAEQIPESLLQLLLRLGVASVFFKSGLTKIASWQFTVQLFADEYKVPILPPEIAALMGTAVELSAPVLLALGLATRLATLPLLGMTFVIQTFVYPQSWSEHLIWTSVLLVLLSRGPGKISMDHIFFSRSGASK